MKKSKKSFQDNFPKIAKEFHPSKNKGIDLKNIAPFSNKKIWWKCPKAEDHEWQSSPANRARRKNCPFCAGARASKGNDLNNFPEIAKQLDENKNKGLKPKDILPSSNKKLWWKCQKGDDHEWEQIVHHRTSRQNKCPFCANLKLSKDNSLLNKFPKISEEWHVFKNKDLKPEQVIFSSSENVWWQCKKMLIINGRQL